jgi:hypothetical protein
MKYNICFILSLIILNSLSAITLETSLDEAADKINTQFEEAVYFFVSSDNMYINPYEYKLKLFISNKLNTRLNREKNRDTYRIEKQTMIKIEGPRYWIICSLDKNDLNIKVFNIDVEDFKNEIPLFEYNNKVELNFEQYILMNFESFSSIGESYLGFSTSSDNTLFDYNISIVTIFIDNLDTNMGIKMTPFKFSYSTKEYYATLLNLNIYWNIFKYIKIPERNNFLTEAIFNDDNMFGPFFEINLLKTDFNKFELNNILFNCGLKFSVRHIEPNDYLLSIFNIETSYRYINGKHQYYFGVQLLDPGLPLLLLGYANGM